MEIKIVIAMHKKYKIPNDKMYIPLLSGKSCNLIDDPEYVKDINGINISDKNFAYNDSCHLYWAWKNLNSDYIGLIHYRKLLGLRKTKNVWDNLLTSNQAQELTKKYDVILPKKARYYIFTLYSHYVNTFKSIKNVHIIDLKIMRETISDLYPKYLNSFDEIMKRHSGHMGHICLMKKDLFREYCQFTFDVMFEAEKRLQGKRHDYDRYCGGLTEFLLDVWLHKNNLLKSKRTKEINMLFTELPPFHKKLFALIKRMFFGKPDNTHYIIPEDERNINPSYSSDNTK